jgi:hypothetical protein
MNVFRKNDQPEEKSTPQATADLAALAQPAPAVKSQEPVASKVEKAAQLPPEMLNASTVAYLNSTISIAIKEAVSSLAPILAQIQAAQHAPDPKMVERERRERAIFAQDLEEQRQSKAALQRSCPHKYPSGMYSISVIHNYPDRAPRGVCHLCQKLFEPKRWVIDAPDAAHPRGTPRIVDGDPQYNIVLEIEALKS